MRDAARLPLPADPAPDAALLASILQEVRALRDDMAALRADLGRRGQFAHHTGADDVLAGLLAAIVAAIGDHTFCTVDLLTRVPSPDDERLRCAIVAACGELSPRRIGKLLRRHEGRDVAGLRIVRTGLVAREGTVWQVIACLRV